MLRRLATGAMRRSDDQALYVETKTFSEGACLLLHCFCFRHSTCGKAHKQPRCGRRGRQKRQAHPCNLFFPKLSDTRQQYIPDWPIIRKFNQHSNRSFRKDAITYRKMF